MDPVRALLEQYRGTDPSHPGPPRWRGEGKRMAGVTKERSHDAGTAAPHREGRAIT